MNDGLDDDDYPDDDDDDINTTNTTSNTSKITVDEAFASYVGQIRRGQLKQFLLSSSAWLPAAFLTLVSVFTQRTPEWECVNDDDENDDILYSNCTEQKAKRIEDDLSVLCSLNEYYEENKKNNTEEIIVWKWTNKKQSIVSEFNLICKEEY